MGQLRTEFEQAGTACRLEEQAHGAVGELVARGALHRPARIERLVRGKDLLDQHDLAGAGLFEVTAQPLQVRPRVGQAVDMIHPQPGHGGMPTQLQDVGVGACEHVGVLDTHADQRSDVEEPPVIALRVGGPPVRGPEVLGRQDQRGSGPGRAYRRPRETAGRRASAPRPRARRLLPPGPRPRGGRAWGRARARRGDSNRCQRPRRAATPRHAPARPTTTRWSGRPPCGSARRRAARACRGRPVRPAAPGSPGPCRRRGRCARGRSRRSHASCPGSRRGRVKGRASRCPTRSGRGRSSWLRPDQVRAAAAGRSIRAPTCSLLMALAVAQQQRGMCRERHDVVADHAAPGTGLRGVELFHPETRQLHAG